MQAHGLCGGESRNPLNRHLPQPVPPGQHEAPHSHQCRAPSLRDSFVQPVPHHVPTSFFIRPMSPPNPVVLAPHLPRQCRLCPTRHSLKEGENNAYIGDISLEPRVEEWMPKGDITEQEQLGGGAKRSFSETVKGGRKPVHNEEGVL
ncbi:hypothetical protein PIB30_052009 [Stylosanthes scabra]|uniref:Uncharacterized protein n=1 Tax=Stylosanthes scabra TaxID=79078 RepID=A0ABU6WI20_9FABA|nr:hypothetical protein [Stylosanthes scabra]